MPLKKAAGIIGALRTTPSEIKAEVLKKFKIGLTGSENLAGSIFNLLAEDLHLDSFESCCNEPEKKFIQTFPMPKKPDDLRCITTSAILCFFYPEDATPENLKIFKMLRRLKPPAHLFIIEPETPEEKHEILKSIENIGIIDYDWMKPVFYEGIKEKAKTLLEVNGAYDMAMAFRFPILRPAMADITIRKTSVQNMLIALASSVTSNIPVIGVIIGFLAVAGETTVLTINQVKMGLQIAGIYGLEMSLIERMKELWPIIGSGMGFRALARALIGLVPVAGAGIKATVAYGGTYAAGKSANWYYEKGRKINKEEYLSVIRESRTEAIKALNENFGRFKKFFSRKNKDDEEKIKQIESEIEKLEIEVKEIESIQEYRA